VDKRSRKIVTAPDNRYRVTRSEELWVISRYRSPETGNVESYTILESIERCVYRSISKGTEHVRVDSRFHLLHPIAEFRQLVKQASQGEFELHNNEAYDDDHIYSALEVLAYTKPAPFIFLDEKGAWV